MYDPLKFVCLLIKTTLRKSVDTTDFFTVFFAIILSGANYFSPDFKLVFNTFSLEDPLIIFFIVFLCRFLISPYIIWKNEKDKNAKLKNAKELNYFKSERLHIVYGGKYVLGHGLDHIPENVNITLVCTDSELGYAQDDEVKVDNSYFEITKDLKYLNIFGPNINPIKLRKKNAPAHQSTEVFKITQTKWRHRVTAW